MRNRAKCKKCGDILESLTLLDVVECSCGEIAISGGKQELNTFANDYANFLRVDDEGRESAVKFVEEGPADPSPHGLGGEKPEKVASSVYRDERKATAVADDEAHHVNGCREKIFSLEQIAEAHKSVALVDPRSPITHYDTSQVLPLLVSILRDLCKD